MTKHAKSVSRKIAPKPSRDPQPQEAGPRVFPLPGTRVSMPSVGTRRSTRVFVPKSASKAAADDPAARVLRSGKRLVLSKATSKKAGGDGDAAADGWPARLLDNPGAKEHSDCWRVEKEGSGLKQGETEGFWCQFEEDLPKCVAKEDSQTPSQHGREFDIVYSRKRRRSQSDVSDPFSSQEQANEVKDGATSLSGRLVSSSTKSGDKDSDGHRFGVVFARKPRKNPRVSSVVEAVPRSFECSGKGPDAAETAHDFAEKIGILERDPWFGSAGHVVLVVLIQSSTSAGSYRFTCFLVSILSWMMKKKVGLFECAAFMSSRSVGRVFSLQGIHFLPVRHWDSDFSRRSTIFDAGICIIFGARLLIPLVTVNFSALPFLFKSLHLSISLSSFYLPSVLARYQRELCLSAHKEVSFEERRLYISHNYPETCTSRMEVTSFESPAANKSDVDHASQKFPDNNKTSAAESHESAVSNSTTANNVRFQKNKRKRSSLRSGRTPSHSSLKRRRKNFVERQNGKLKADTAAKVRPRRESCVIESVREKFVDACVGQIYTEEEYATPSPTPTQKRRKCTSKNSMLRLKELDSTFPESKQNIDTLSCSANILVIESDKCWREEGAKVMLELSSSNEWHLAVKLGDTNRYLHKAQETKPSTTNRYTHAMMWSGENGWKLEFCDKKDWNVFKELHRECYERNLQEVPIRIIPVPGVREVSGYEESFTSIFERPDSYIHMVDEVERVLMSQNACYDMDSGDEEWLEQLNSSSLSEDTDSFTPISNDNFEKIIFAFEKAAYIHPDDVSEPEKAAALCSNFGRRNMVAAAFDYWMKKRKLKRCTLVRVFQGQPPRKTQQTMKPLLRKKRSFKRQGSHTGRGKPEIFLEAAASQDAIRKLQEAEAEANRAVDVAIQLRSRAQILMMNADLAAYKSFMASRLAEALQESESPDNFSSILD